MSECQVTEDKVSKWYTDTFLTPDTLKEKEERDKEISDTLKNEENEENRSLSKIKTQSDTLTPDTRFRGMGLTKELQEQFSKLPPDEQASVLEVKNTIDNSEAKG